MNPLRNFIQSFIKKPEKKSIEPSELPLVLGNVDSPQFPPLEESEYLNWFRSWSYIAISAIAESVAEVKLNLFRDGSNVKAVTEHEVLSLLEHPNRILGFSFYTLVELTQIYEELAGECFWLINKIVGQPSTIWVLRPDWMIIHQKGAEVIKYEYGSGGKKIPFEPDEIIHFKYPNPLNMFRGKSTIEAADITLSKDREAEKYNYNFFKNSGLPKGILKTTKDSKLSPEALERFKVEWKKEFRGSNKANQVAILSNMDWQDLGMSQKDMDFIQAAKFDRDKILAMFRVPKSVVGLTDGVNLANAKAGELTFKKNTIKPKMKRLVDTLNTQLLPMFNVDDLFFTFDSPVPEDRKADAEMAKIGVQSGFLTPNEARHMMELPITKDKQANKLYLPTNLIPIADVDQPTVKKPTAPKEKLTKLFIRKFVRKQLKIAYKDIVKITKAVKKKDIKTVDRLVGELRWKQMVERIESDEKELREVLRTQFKRQEAEVLKRLNGGNIIKDVSNTKFKFKLGDIFQLLKEQALFVIATTPIITRILNREHDIASQFVGASETGLPEAKIAEYISKEVAKFAKSVNKNIRKSIVKQLKDGLLEGENITDIGKRISGVYSLYQGTKSLQIARTEVMRATNFSSVDAYKQAGFQAKQWLTAADERTCEFCNPLDGTRIKINDNFFDKGAEFTGERGGVMPLGYSDTPFPPLHPSCRCTIIPVISKGVKLIDDNMINILKENTLKHLTSEAEAKIRKAGIETYAKFNALLIEVKKITDEVRDSKKTNKPSK